MDEKNERNKISPLAGTVKERPGELKKSISAEPNIPEENIGDELKRPKNASGNAGSWRQQYSGRRKSITEFNAENPPQLDRQQKNKNKFNAPNQKFSNDEQASDAQTVKHRRSNYGRANSHRTFSTSKKQAENPAPRTVATRSLSTSQQNSQNNYYNQHHRNSCHYSQDDSEAISGDDGPKKRTRGYNSIEKRRFKSTSMNSMNGESFDYDDEMELEEPFSDSDEESSRYVQQKPCLIIPRGRIRTLSGTVPPNGYSPKWGGPTMCLCCLQFFDLPNEIKKFADHLFKDHHIVIEEVDLIVDPKRYIEHWRQRFAKESVENIFLKIIPDENDFYFGSTDYYYEMSERLPEDYSLRQRLAMRRLEEALGCQQREREEISFSMQCIFCRYVARGNRSKIIHHLYMIHHLNLGSPDNLVFVSEYIDHLREKLQRNECLYCERTFSDRNVLMDHMRKRNHREVNPKNNYYDKFYIINYLELGKRWLDVLAEDFEDTMPTFIDSDDEEEEESWHEWQEDNMDIDQIRGVCLFCNFNSELIEDFFEHMENEHSFNLLQFIEDEKLEFYDRMKFLNFIRKESFGDPKTRLRNENNKPIELPEREQWCLEENLMPMFGNDHFLWMLESYLEKKKILENSDKSEPTKSKKTGTDQLDLTKSVVEGDWDNINKSFSKLKRQTSVEATALPVAVQHSIFKAYVEESKVNSVEGIIAEDWPDLSDSLLSKKDMYKAMR